MSTGSPHPEGGFTLVETLIGLLILAVSSGLLIQSIANASAQIRSARNLIAAEQTALSVLAEHNGSSVRDANDEGVDQGSDLFWFYRETPVTRKEINLELTEIKNIEIEVRLTKDAPVIYRLKTLTIERQSP